MAEKRLLSYRHTAVNSIGTFFSRLTGVIKQPLISYLFGASADPFVLAFRIANTLRRYIGEGALSNAFIPVYRKALEKDGEASASRFAATVLNLFVIITSLITLAGILLAPFYFPPLVLGLKPGSPELASSIRLVMIMMPFTIFISLYAIGMGVLHSHRKFASPSFAPVLFNLSFILCPLLFSRQLGVYSLAVGVVLGGLLMVAAELLELPGTGFRYRPRMNLRDPRMGEFWKLFIPTSLNMLVLTVKNLATTQFLSFFRGASLIFLNVITLIEAPLGIFGLAIGAVLLPMLSRYHAARDAEGFKKSLRESFALLFYFMIPVTLYFLFYSETVINVLFRDTMRLLTGNLGRYAGLLEQTYAATTVYAGALLPMACVILFERIFYSAQNARTPLAANAVVFISSFGLYFLCLIPSVGYLGVFIGDLVASWMTFAFYVWRMEKLSPRSGLWRVLMPGMVVQAAVAGAGVAVIHPFHRYVYSAVTSPAPAMLTGAAEFGLFALFYFVLTRLLGFGANRHAGK